MKSRDIDWDHNLIHALARPPLPPVGSALWKQSRDKLGWLIGPAFHAASVTYSLPLFFAGGVVKTRKELRDILEDRLDGYLQPGALRAEEWFDDNNYYLPQGDEIKTVIMNWLLPLPGSNVPDVFDCEDFAYLTRVQFALHRLYDQNRGSATPFACGVAMGVNLSPEPGRHTANIVVTCDKEIVLVDKTPGNPWMRTLPYPRPARSTMEIHHLAI